MNETNKEIWKPVKGYEDLYKVSNKGNIYSIKSKKILSQSIINSGYKVVGLSKDGICTNMLVHRIVASSFIENKNPDTDIYINHKNEIKTDNRAENLEWCTAIYNSNYGTGKERLSNSITDFYKSEKGKELKDKLRDLRTGKKQSEETIKKRIEAVKEKNKKLTHEERSWLYMPKENREKHSEYMKNRMISLTELERKQLYGHKLDEDTQNRMKFSRQYGRRFQDLEYISPYDLKEKNKELIYDFTFDKEICPLHKSDFQFPVEKGKRGILYFTRNIRDQFDFIEDFEYIN